VIPEFAHHDPELNRGAEIVAILVVKIQGIQSRDGLFQGLEILVQNALRADALGLHQSRDVLTISDV
jgi:hypothetical protein